MSESPTTPDSQIFNIVDGSIEDFNLLPKDLHMEKTENNAPDELGIKIIEPLTFDYEVIKEEIKNGRARLRLMKNGSVLEGFSVITTPQSAEPNVIRMLWTNPDQRGKGIGEGLVQDAINQMPPGEVNMDIWGGEPMMNLAQKLGFNQNPGENMTNRFTYIKK